MWFARSVIVAADRATVAAVDAATLMVERIGERTWRLRGPDADLIVGDGATGRTR